MPPRAGVLHRVPDQVGHQPPQLLGLADFHDRRSLEARPQLHVLLLGAHRLVLDHLGEHGGEIDRQPRRRSSVLLIRLNNNRSSTTEVDPGGTTLQAPQRRLGCGRHVRHCLEHLDVPNEISSEQVLQLVRRRRDQPEAVLVEPLQLLDQLLLALVGASAEQRPSPGRARRRGPPGSPLRSSGLRGLHARRPGAHGLVACAHGDEQQLAGRVGDEVVGRSSRWSRSSSSSPHTRSPSATITVPGVHGPAGRRLDGGAQPGRQRRGAVRPVRSVVGLVVQPHRGRTGAETGDQLGRDHVEQVAATRTGGTPPAPAVRAVSSRRACRVSSSRSTVASTAWSARSRLSAISCISRRAGSPSGQRLVEVEQGTGAAGAVDQARHQHVQGPPALGIARLGQGGHVAVSADGVLELGIHVLLGQEHELPVPRALLQDPVDVAEREAVAPAGLVVRRACEGDQLEEPVAAHDLDRAEPESRPEAGVVAIRCSSAHASGPPQVLVRARSGDGAGLRLPSMSLLVPEVCRPACQAIVGCRGSSPRLSPKRSHARSWRRASDAVTSTKRHGRMPESGTSTQEHTPSDLGHDCRRHGPVTANVVPGS